MRGCQGPVPPEYGTLSIFIMLSHHNTYHDKFTLSLNIFHHHTHWSDCRREHSLLFPIEHHHLSYHVRRCRRTRLRAWWLQHRREPPHVWILRCSDWRWRAHRKRLQKKLACIPTFFNWDAPGCRVIPGHRILRIHRNSSDSEKYLPFTKEKIRLPVRTPCHYLHSTWHVLASI